MYEKKDNAFTLVELLLVVTIIGILAGTVMVNLYGETRIAKINRAKTDINQIGTALSIFELKLGELPTTDQGLLALIKDPGIEGWKKCLQRSSIKDPWGNEYRYSYPGTHDNVYDLISFGPDELEGTEDDIVNWE